MEGASEQIHPAGFEKINVDRPMFCFESEQMKKDTEILHTDCEGHESPQWRRDRTGFTRFHMNDWRNAKVAAKHLKFCPGDHCKVWLPLYNFETLNSHGRKQPRV